MSTSVEYRHLQCGCMDRRDPGGVWSVFRLCVEHFRGRVPVQDSNAGG